MLPKKSIWVFATLIALALAPAGVRADFTMDLSTEFSGATPPAGATPWLTATFADLEGGTVRLTMAAPNLTGTERVDEWLFNLDPTLEPTELIFSQVSATGVTVNSISTGKNFIQADGDGEYDIRFVFDNQKTTSFQDGETVIYDITGISGLTADDFNFLSNPKGGHGPFRTAAHVQAIGTDGSKSGWITEAVPEPSTISLALVGLGGLGLVRWRRWRKAKPI